MEIRMIKKIVNKYNTIPKEVRASLWFTICNFFQKGMAFVTIPIFTRVLSTSEYGIYSLYVSWMSIISIIVTLNLSAGGFNNAMIKYRDDRDGFATAMVGLLGGLEVFFYIIFIILKSKLSDFFGLSEILMSFMFIEMLSTTIFSIWSQRQRFEFNYKPLVIVTLITSAMAPVFSAFSVVYIKNTAETKVASNLLILCIVYAVVLIMILRKNCKIFNWSYWKFAINFNVPLVPHYMSQIVLNQADRIMISNYCGVELAGIYSVAYNVSLASNIFINSIFASFTPWIYEKLSRKDYVSIRKQTSNLTVIFALLTFIPVLIGPEVIAILAPADYQRAVWVVPPVSLSVFFVYVYGLFASIEFFYEKKKFVSIGSVCAALANIVLNMLFIPMFGFIAAGYTSLICYIIYASAHFIFMKKVAREEQCDMNMFDLKLLFIISILLIIVSLIMNVLYNKTVLRYIVILLLFVISFVKRQQIMNVFVTIKKNKK